MRYSLLPYLYTLFYRSHVYGETVARPLFLEFPEDSNTYDIDEQFLWGSALLFNPVLYENASSVRAYLPRGRWYDMGEGTEFEQREGGYRTLAAPLQIVRVLVRGGFVVPRQPPALTTNSSRDAPLALLVAPDQQGMAHGELFWDDGDSIDTIEREEYNMYSFMLINKNKLVVRVDHRGYANDLRLGSVVVLGVPQKIREVLLEDRRIEFQYSTEKKMLTIMNISEPLVQDFVITWSC